jgi:arthrofactin-type cyclic lipopeptide synthetase C
VHEDAQLTYAELNAKANRLAHHLRGLGVKPDALVAIGLERSIELVVAELAILKCGAAHVPLDQNAPIKRQAFMIEDCEAQIVLTAKGQVVQISGVKRVDVDELTPTGQASHDPAVPVVPLLVLNACRSAQVDPAAAPGQSLLGGSAAGTGRRTAAA